MTKLKAKKPTEVKQKKAKILVFGKSGVGKTWASLDFPNVYYIDTEGGATEKRYMEKLNKSNGVYLGVEDGSQDFEEIISQVKALATEKHEYKTLIIDSISKITGAENAKEQERLGDKDAFGASKKKAINYTRRLINWLEKIDMNVILIGHEKDLWKAGEVIGETFDAWEKIEYELDLCFQIKKIGSSRKAFVKKSRLEAFQEGASFDWSYAEFADRYGKSVIEGEVKHITLASPEAVAELERLVALFKVDADITDKWLKVAQCDTFAEMEASQVEKCIQWLNDKFKQ